jgi:hypothetical protein
MPKANNNDIIIPRIILDHLKDIVVEGKTNTPKLDLEDIRDAILEINSVQVEIDSQRDNISQRRKIINFFLWFILAQSTLTFGAVFYCIYLMSHNRLEQNEYDWILNVLRIGIMAIVVEVVGYLGIVVHYLFRKRAS